MLGSAHQMTPPSGGRYEVYSKPSCIGRAIAGVERRRKIPCLGAVSISLRLAGVGHDAFEDDDDLEWSFQAHALVGHLQRRSIWRHFVCPRAEHLSVGLGANLQGLRIRTTPIGHRAGWNTRDRTATEVEQRTSPAVSRDRLRTFRRRLAVHHAIRHDEVPVSVASNRRHVYCGCGWPRAATAPPRCEWLATFLQTDRQSSLRSFESARPAREVLVRATATRGPRRAPIIPTAPCCCQTRGTTSSPSCSSPSPQVARKSRGNARAIRRYMRLQPMTNALMSAPPVAACCRGRERDP